MCQDCGRQYVINPDNAPITAETKALIDKLLQERISLAGIARVVEVSERWLQDYVNVKYETVPKQAQIEGQEPGPLTIQCDEMWSFVGHKANKKWVWLAMDVNTRQIVAVYVGRRDKQGAQGLWDNLPTVYRQCAVAYTDFWDAYAAIFPESRHRPVGKHTGQTNYIERFNCTMRQRVSRLVRKTLSFSKKLTNHIGAIWYFVHHYNTSLT
jgi:IS1 family transposase